MKQKLILMTLALFLLSPLSAFAHSGGTDSRGGHYNRSTGEYHYHHGYSAHQHPNGVCPYDNKNKTESRTSSTKPPSSSKHTSSEDNDITSEFLIGAGAGSAIIYALKKLRGRK